MRCNWDNNSDLLSYLKYYTIEVEVQFGVKLRVLRIDGGGKYSILVTKIE